ncbi:MAG: DUF5615 family PIN-like protein [Verrucomicrobiota bacterium]
MKVLLDECLPRRLAKLIEGHEVLTVQACGWSGIKNGDLLRLAAEKFDAFITPDRGLPFEQNYKGLNLAIVAVTCRSNRLEDLKPLVPWLAEALGQVEAGKLIRVG